VQGWLVTDYSLFTYILNVGQDYSIDTNFIVSRQKCNLRVIKSLLHDRCELKAKLPFTSTTFSPYIAQSFYIHFQFLLSLIRSCPSSLSASLFDQSCPSSPPASLFIQSCLSSSGSLFDHSLPSSWLSLPCFPHSIPSRETLWDYSMSSSRWDSGRAPVPFISGRRRNIYEEIASIMKTKIRKKLDEMRK